MMDAPAPKTLEGELLNSIRQIGIPPRPLILEQVVAEMGRDEPDLRALARAISADVGIAGSLLKVVNSPFYGYRSKARTVQDALSMLGLAVAASTIAGIVLRKALPPMPRLERFWDASARVARLSAWLSQKCEAIAGLRAEDAYTFSLFRDCGIPIMMRKFPNYFEILAAANGDPALPFTVVEEQHLPTNHAVVGCLLAQSWWLAEETCLAIRNHHDFITLAAGGGALPPLSRNLIAIAGLAEYIDQQLTGQNQTNEWLKIGKPIQAYLGLSDPALAALVIEAGTLPTESD